MVTFDTFTNLGTKVRKKIHMCKFFLRKITFNKKRTPKDSSPECVLHCQIRYKFTKKIAYEHFFS